MPVTGEQYVVQAGGTHAVITGVGAGLRSLTVDGAALTETFDADVRPPLGAGCVLVPWPNRTAGARWSWRGVEQHLEVTEEARGHAIHGLLRRATWTPVEHTADSLTLAADVERSPGWPQPLHVETTYAVSARGLAVEHTITDTGDGPVPVGVGTHPYLRVGGTAVSDAVLTVATATVLDTDDALIPTDTRPVTATEDLRGGRRVGDLTLDTCFGRADADGPLARLTAPDGRGVELWADASVRWVQVFTPDGFPRPDGTEGRAVAVEPMTCPPDALNSGAGLQVLEPGGSWSVRWGIAPAWKLAREPAGAPL